MTLLENSKANGNYLPDRNRHSSAHNSRAFRSIDCDVLHWVADNGSLDSHATAIGVDALYCLCRDACVCVSFVGDYCKTNARRSKNENANATTVAGGSLPDWHTLRSAARIGQIVGIQTDIVAIVVFVLFVSDARIARMPVAMATLRWLFRLRVSLASLSTRRRRRRRRRCRRAHLWRPLDTIATHIELLVFAFAARRRSNAQQILAAATARCGRLQNVATPWIQILIREHELGWRRYDVHLLSLRTYQMHVFRGNRSCRCGRECVGIGCRCRQILIRWRRIHTGCR